MECYLLQGLKGVENVFTQHTCWLKEILEDVFKGRTIDPLYPCFGSEPFRSVCQHSRNSLELSEVCLRPGSSAELLEC